MDDRDLEAFLRARGVQAELLRLPEPTPTVEAAARVLGVPVERIAKSVLFLVEGPDGGETPAVIVVANGAHRVDYRRVAGSLGISRRRLKLAGPAQVLALTGYAVGAVPPLGYPRPLRTLIDARVLAQPEVYAGGGALDAMLRITPAELLRVTPAEIADVAGPRPAAAQA